MIEHIFCAFQRKEESSKELFTNLGLSIFSKSSQCWKLRTVLVLHLARRQLEVRNLESQFDTGSELCIRRKISHISLYFECNYFLILSYFSPFLSIIVVFMKQSICSLGK